MNTFILTCCSTADMSAAYFLERDIPYVSFHFHLNGQEYPDDLGQSVPYDEFYEQIAAGAMPTTSQVNVDEFIAFFEPFLQEGKDILHISLSSGLSGSFQSANIARESLLANYPERQIFVLDSLGASSGYGLLVDMAADLRDSGLPIAEVHERLMDIRLTVHHWFFSTDLSHYKRGGRISSATAVIGMLLGICPLLNMDQQGNLKQRSKIRGKKQVILEMVQKMVTHAKDGIQYAGKCFISHSHCADDAKQLAAMIQETFQNLSGNVLVNSVGTVIGSHTGPGTVALFFQGDLRTE